MISSNFEEVNRLKLGDIVNISNDMSRDTRELKLGLVCDVIGEEVKVFPSWDCSKDECLNVIEIKDDEIFGDGLYGPIFFELGAMLCVKSSEVKSRLGRISREKADEIYISKIRGIPKLKSNALFQKVIRWIT